MAKKQENKQVKATQNQEENLQNKQQNQPVQEQNQPDPSAQENAENQDNSTEQNENKGQATQNIVTGSDNTRSGSEAETTLSASDSECQEGCLTERHHNEQNEQEETNQQNQPELQTENDLVPFLELAAKHRLPTWQSAAILKLLDKEDDAYLTEQEFLSALQNLYNRKMGK